MQGNGGEKEGDGVIVQGDAACGPVTAGSAAVDADLSSQVRAPGRPGPQPVRLFDEAQKALVGPAFQGVGRGGVIQPQGRAETPGRVFEAYMIYAFRGAAVSLPLLGALGAAAQADAEGDRKSVV